jgi:hypothetical protein
VSGYRIDEQVLLDVADALDRGGAAVAEGADALGAAVADGLGSPTLDAVAGELLAGWSAALTGLHGAVADTSTGVHRCLADYTGTEQRIAGLFSDVADRRRE